MADISDKLGMLSISPGAKTAMESVPTTITHYALFEGAFAEDAVLRWARYGARAVGT